MRRVIYAVVVMLVTVGGPLAVAAPASAVVLVNQPASSVCVGKTFTVGVWYQQSGGSRAYRVAVYNPQRARILYKRGRAPSSHWRFWHVAATRRGRYRTVYHIRVNGKWWPYRVVTRARHC